MITTSLLLASMLSQSTPPTEPLKAKIESLSFMVGHWEGNRGPAWIQEVWTAPKDGIMHASFRMHQDGKLVFSESERIIQEGEFVRMKLKHFDPDFNGYEEKNETTDFVLTAVTKDSVSFYQKDEHGDLWLSYKRSGNTTQAWITRSADKPSDESIFKFKLVK